MTLKSALQSARFLLTMDYERNQPYRPVYLYRSIHGGYGASQDAAAVRISHVVATIDR